MKSLREVGEHGVAARGTDQRDAERQPIGPHRSRYRAGGEIEQVHEVGVVTHASIGIERIGEHGFDRIRGGRSRYDHDVGLLPGPCGGFAQRVQARGALEQVGSRVFRGAADDLFYDRVDLVRMLLEEVTDRCHAFGNPRTFV
jgi:hypothetical protein